MRPELYLDMRRADAATWIPDSEMIVETLNQTGFGCLELSANGLYGMKLQEGCEEQLRPSCEYTGKLHPDIDPVKQYTYVSTQQNPMGPSI